MIEQVSQNRIVWLDWMKVMAILSIIWGHFFSAGHVYLYVFSVQTFCLISGFLYKKNSSLIICLRKCFWQLFVPTVIMSLIIHLADFFLCRARGVPYIIDWLWFFKWLLLGNRWCMGPCWYFYSLIVMRLIMQVLPDKNWVLCLLFCILSGGAILLHENGIVVSNANVNVLVCMPFFLIGFFLKSLKCVLKNLHNYYIEAGLLMLAIALVYICGNYNGYVWMYLCGYGNNYVFYLIGGIAGTMVLYVLSLWLGRQPYRSMVTNLSKGSILVIGLHIILVKRLMMLPARSCEEDLFFSILIMLCFIPIIRMTELFFPVLLGRKNVIEKASFLKWRRFWGYI